MIEVSIGGVRRKLEDVSESWITEQIVRRSIDGMPTCVRVEIQTPGINMCLATAACGGGFGSRLPNEAEQRIFDLWARMKLNLPGFAPKDMCAFLNRVTGFLHY